MDFGQTIKGIFEWVNKNGLVSSGIAFTSTLLITFGTGFIQEIFKKREEKRLSIEDFIGKVTDVVADACATGYKDCVSPEEKKRLMRAAAQIERLGNKDMALNIRRFLNTWMDYWHIYGIPRENKNAEILPNEKIELIKKLDNLTDKILGKKESWKIDNDG